MFRQWYSEVGNAWKQLFHAWRSFNFDENRDTIDAYATWIRQVTVLLGYGESQILEIFKNTLPMKLYWILFPIEDLRQTVETAKRILTKEKLDKQLTGKASTSPFISIREGASRRVSFDTREELNDKIDKLTVMIGKLVVKIVVGSDNLNPRYIKAGVKVRTEVIVKEIIRTGTGQTIDQIVGIEDSSGKTGRPRFEQGYRRSSFWDNSRGYSRQNSRGEYRISSYRNDGYNRCRNRSRERSFSGHCGGNRTRSTSSSRLKSGSRASTNRESIRYYNFREHDHFARDCPASREERDIDQLQQMLNLEEDQTYLLMNTQNNPVNNPE